VRFALACRTGLCDYLNTDARFYNANFETTPEGELSLGDGALQLIYRTPDGGMKERLLSRADEVSISVATVERPFSFDGDGAAL